MKEDPTWQAFMQEMEKYAAELQEKILERTAKYLAERLNEWEPGPGVPGVDGPGEPTSDLCEGGEGHA